MAEKHVPQGKISHNSISIEEISDIIIGKIDEIYNNYVNITRKKAKLEAVKKIVDGLKQKLGKNIYTVNIRWLPRIGEAEVVVDLSSDSELVKRIAEIWNYLFRSYKVDYVKLVITTYNIISDLDKHEEEEAVKILGAQIYVKRTGTVSYNNYIPISSIVVDNIPIYIYIMVADYES